MDGYASINDAAAAALVRINYHSDSALNEYISLIYQDPKTGEYVFTNPQSRGARGNTKGTFRIPKGSLRAIIHNHPGSDSIFDYLSADDMRMANQFDVPSFLGRGNTLLRWTGDWAGPVRQRRGLTEEVLARIPIDELKRQAAKRREEHIELFAKPTGNPIAAGNEMSQKQMERP